MASEALPVASNLDNGKSKAQDLASKHASVEDVPDEELASDTADHSIDADSAPSTEDASPDNSARKPSSPSERAKLDTGSHEAFPELGGPKFKGGAGAAPVWGAKNDGTTPTNGSPRTSTPIFGHGSPVPMVIPGRNVESVILENHHLLPRSQLKRPIPDIVNEINRKSRARIALINTPTGCRLEATGPQDIAQQALKDLVQQIGVKTHIKLPIPFSARAHIIGRGGSTIKSLQERTGAKIQLPKLEDSPANVDDDDERTIDVAIEGNSVSAAMAREAILRIVGERSTSVQTKLRVPAEFYPFIAGPRNCNVGKMEESGEVQVRIPPHQPWTSQPTPRPPTTAGERPIFLPVANDNCIELGGSRDAVQRARAEIERRAQELHNELEVGQASIERGRYQFIVGPRGSSMEDFFAETGCVILFPTDEDEDMVTLIGPPQRVPVGLERAEALALDVQCSNLDIARNHRNAPIGAAAHARNVTRYLRHRKEIERIEKLHNTYINTPFSPDGGALPWELYFSRDNKNYSTARSEINDIVNGHPPSRMVTFGVDPFFHTYLRKNITPHVREAFGVQIILPDAADGNVPLLLVYEGGSAPEYQVPRSVPSQEDVRRFESGLEEARNHILSLINKQENIISLSIDVPAKFHDKLKRFIKKEQEIRAPDQIPARVSSLGTMVTMRGPTTAVELLAAKVAAIVEQEKQDEKERDFVTSFEFPQKFVNHLIGKGGSRIRELHERFDVEIQVQDGNVELKGPKAKADAAKSYISKLGRTLMDEVTHVLRIEPKFHRELIGAQGSQINRLQTRYKVLIFFPRSAKAGSDDQSNGDGSSDAGKTRRQQAPDEIIIRGPKKGADEARDELSSLYQWLKENSFTATVTMQRKHVPLLIGQGGATMDEIRQTTEARIDVPADRDAETVDIQIKGTKSQVAAAKKIVEEKRAVFDDTIIKEIEVDKKHHKALIGPNGSALKEIILQAGGPDNRRDLSRTIQFPKQESDGGKIKVEGRTEVVEKITARIQEIVAKREAQVTEVLEVPIEKHKTLIGRGGDVKRKLESQLGVSIDVPRQGDGKTGVRIVGLPANVEKAKEHIQDMVKEQKGETVDVPRKLHTVLSNGGQFFRRLRGDYDVTVDHAGHSVPRKQQPPPRANGEALPLITDDAETAAEAHSWRAVDSGSGEEGIIPWVLRGAPENMEKAKKAIQMAMEQAAKNSVVGYLILADPKTYRHVIGPNGSRVNAIRKQSGCAVNVPKSHSESEAIEVAGSREGVEKAKDLILAAVKEGTGRQ